MKTVLEMRRVQHHPHQNGEYSVIDGAVLFCCPGCGELCLANPSGRGHIVRTIEPLTITPSIVCHGGCHYYITGGKVDYREDHRTS